MHVWVFSVLSLQCSKINVSEEYQAELADCDETKQGVDQDDDFSELVSRPRDNLSRDDEVTRKLFSAIYMYCICIHN